MKIALPMCGCRRSPSTVRLICTPVPEQGGGLRQVARRGPQVEPHGVELLDRDQLGLAGVADQVAQLDFQLADPSVDRGVHLAVPRLISASSTAAWALPTSALARVDVDLEVGRRLVKVGAVGVDLGRALQLLGLGFVIVFLRRRFAASRIRSRRSSTSSSRIWA